MKRGGMRSVLLAAAGMALCQACSRSGGVEVSQAPPPLAAAPAAPQSKEALPPPLPAEKLALDPAAYSGVIAVSGRVVRSEPARHRFTLGCEDSDSCVAIPVHFAGKPPAARTDVVVRGRLARDPQGRYTLEADSVEHP